ncbi:hypothetical protein BIW11_04844 [Tropilaelaps mercedesae]|uniref:Protein sleepless n=1 Tax=Tropilaelaps mercedesae TaxID=418985 RepID=A0A1V9X136_9ACAR|nr:hypothetical protein BIW11_04844 [Tropilaelaps mercedesae]
MPHKEAVCRLLDKFCSTSLIGITTEMYFQSTVGTLMRVNGNWRVIRSCAYLGEPGEGHGDENYCLMRTGTFDVFVETCTCNSKDGCNTAHRRLTASPSVLLVAAVTFAIVSGVTSGLMLNR